MTPKFIRVLRYRAAWWRWLLGYPPYRMGDPLLGQGEVREKNRRILNERYNALEPQPEEFGLTAEDRVKKR